MNEQQFKHASALLNEGAWFGTLPAALKDLILRNAVMRSYSKGQILQAEDRPSRGLIAVLEGQVSMLRHVSPHEPVLIHLAGPGYWFGEGGVLLDDAPFTTAIARCAVKAMILSKTEFGRIVTDEPRYYPAFARIALERYRLTCRFLAEALRLSPDGRLRLRLADLADHRRTLAKVDGEVVDLNISQSELAGTVGLSRQRVNARLRRLQDEGWIRLAPRRIFVLDAKGLRASVAALEAVARGRAAGIPRAPVSV